MYIHKGRSNPNSFRVMQTIYKIQLNDKYSRNLCLLIL